ncbi:MAG: GNAT family N-acetyltransferase [Bacteroidota bacterium]
MIQIIPYQSRYQPQFKILNLEWLDKYGLTEEPDLKVLNDPEGTILAGGGVIFLAESQEEIVGTAALICEHDGIYELAKMAVRPDMQGKGISKLLIEACLDAAREVQAKKLVLFSNSQLATALKLYEKYGFAYVKVEDSPFLTADIKMELSL